MLDTQPRQDISTNYKVLICSLWLQEELLLLAFSASSFHLFLLFLSCLLITLDRKYDMDDHFHHSTKTFWLLALYEIADGTDP